MRAFEATRCEETSLFIGVLNDRQFAGAFLGGGIPHWVVSSDADRFSQALFFGYEIVGLAGALFGLGVPDRVVCADADGLSEAYLLVVENTCAFLGDGIVDGCISRLTKEIAWCFGLNFSLCLVLAFLWKDVGIGLTGSGSSKYSGQPQCKEREKESFHREIRTDVWNLLSKSCEERCA